MINAIEFVPFEGAGLTLRADKNVKEKNAWHLKTIGGNGLPPVSVIGSASYGLAGASYNGVNVESREIELELYADGYSAAGLQQMLTDASRIMSVSNEALGYLRLINSLGKEFRIAAKPTDFAIDTHKSRTALLTMALECPFVYFEDDAPSILPVYAVEGGKEYVSGQGLERPYTFGNITAGTGAQTIAAFNPGDVATPCIFRLFGSGLSMVEIENTTTGASILVQGMSVAGIEICTDPNNLYARFADGTDASAYVSLADDLSTFELVPGANELQVSMTATSVQVAGTEIEYRGRYSLCL